MGKPDPQTDPLFINPHLTATFESDGRVHSPSTMRAIAGVLTEHLETMEQPGVAGPALTAVQLDAAQFGAWVDATIFGATAGKDSAGQKLGQVRSEFVQAYKDVIAAIQASAGNHAEADTRNEGG
jgi:hypothetical protein